MKTLLLLSSLLAVQAPARPAELRSLSFSATTDKGAPAAGLVRDEIAVLENGVVREVMEVRKDERPLTLALLVDTSQAVSSSYRLHLVDPLVSFLGRLPSGTRYAIWTTGDRPMKAVDFTTEVSEAGKLLRRTAPQGGNTILDAIVEAVKDLAKQEGQRTAVVIVTSLGVEFSNRERHAIVDEVKGKAEIFSAIQFDAGSEGTSEMRLNYEFVLGELTKRTGGMYESTLSSMSVASLLERIAADLGNRYLLSYATLPELKQRKLEIKVARPGVKVRLGAPSTKP